MNKIIAFIIWFGVYQDVCGMLDIEPRSFKEFYSEGEK